MFANAVSFGQAISKACKDLGPSQMEFAAV